MRGCTATVGAGWRNWWIGTGRRFRQDYNQVRPHEALGVQTPASVYGPSPQPYLERLPELTVTPGTMQVRTVKAHGHFRWKKHDIFLSEVLWGKGGDLAVEIELYGEAKACAPAHAHQQKTGFHLAHPKIEA